MPPIPKKSFDPASAKAGQDQSFVMPATGDIDHEDFVDNFEIIDDNSEWKDAAKLAAFMEEPVEVIILSSENPNAEQVIQLSVNRVNQFLFRGVKQVIKRKYVEVLFRSKPESLKTEEFVDATGARAIRIVKTSGLRYPFSILHDANPNGIAWAERLQREG